MYSEFLNQKTLNIETSRKEYTHRELRRSFYSLVKLYDSLFVFEENPNTPKTSNSTEGHFSHIKDVLKIHRGLSRSLKEEVISSILLAFFYCS